MPGAMKRKAPINLNASPSRLAPALARQPRTPSNVTSASTSKDSITVDRNIENGSMDEDAGDDLQSGRLPAPNEFSSTKTVSGLTSPADPAPHVQPLEAMDIQSPQFSPISGKGSSPVAHYDARGHSTEEPFQSTVPRPETIFSPRSRDYIGLESSPFAHYRSPRIPNHSELYQPFSPGQRSPVNSYSADPTTQLEGSSPLNHSRQDLQESRSNSNSPTCSIFGSPVPPRHENILHQVLSAIMPVLDNHNQTTFERFNGMEDAIRSLAEEVKRSREDGKAQNAKFLEVLKGGYAAQSGDSQRIENRLEDIANCVKEKTSSEEIQGFITRLDSMSAALETMSENVNTLKPADPMDTSGAEPIDDTTVKTFADASTSYDVPEEALEAERAMRAPSPEPPVRVEMATSPIIMQQYLDAAVEALPLDIETEDIGISTERVGYIDAGTARTPEPEPMEVDEPPVQRVNVATSPMRGWYVDSGNMPRTPDPSPVRHALGVMTSPSPLPPRRQYAETGTNARSPELILQRFSVGLMTSPSPQRFAASSLGGRTSARNSIGSIILAEAHEDDENSVSNRLSRSPEIHLRSISTRSSSLPNTRPGTPDDFNMLTQRTDSMPGMVTPPVSSPPLDLRVFNMSTRPVGPKLKRLSYVLSEQVNWNESIQGDQAETSTSPSQNAEPLENATPPPEPSNLENDWEEEEPTHAGSAPASPVHMASPCLWRSASSDEEVESSVKDEQIYETIEEASSAQQTFNSSINEFSQHESYSQPGQSSIGTFGESLDKAGQPEISSIDTFGEESLPEGPSVEEEDHQRNSRAISIESSSPEISFMELQDEPVNSNRALTVETQEPYNSEEHRYSPDVALEDQEPTTKPAEEVTMLSSRIPSPYYPVSGPQGSPVRDQEKNDPMQRATTPDMVFDDIQPYSPASSASDQEGSELSVARLVMGTASDEVREKLSAILESPTSPTCYAPSPPFLDPSPEVPREVIDLSTPTPSAPSSPVRSEVKDRAEAPLFKFKAPQSNVIAVPSPRPPMSPVRPRTPLFLPSTPTPSISESVAPRRITSPLHVPSSRSSSPLSEPPHSDENRILIDSDSDIEYIPVRKRQTEPTAITVKTEPISKNKKILNIKAAALGQPSAATTRVRKRKTKPVDPSEEPPLKRARERSVFAADNDEVKVKTEDNAITVRRASSARLKGKEKETVSAPQKKTTPRPRAAPRRSQGSTPKATKWPPFPKGNADKGFFKQWIECSSCENWYHHGCVGVRPNDRILKSSKVYICPPCKAESGSGPRAASMLPDVHKEQRYCARPDCGNPAGEENQFFVDCIIGRVNKVVGGRGRHYRWLIRWDGFPDKEATWEDESALDDSSNLILDFYKKAEAEGFFPEDDPYSLMILQEALDNGCPQPDE